MSARFCPLLKFGGAFVIMDLNNQSCLKETACVKGSVLVAEKIRRKWVEALKRARAKALAALYAEDAVDHQLSFFQTA